MIDVFQKWFASHFYPTVKHYCEKDNIEPKALLLLDYAPGHPHNPDKL
jgi:hypothetical protein